MVRGALRLTTCVLGLLLPDVVSAQRLRGRLLDLVSNEPLGAGLVTLLAADGTSLVTAVADRDGYWVLEVPRSGTYSVAARRIGYQRWVAGPVVIQSGDDLSSVFHLRRLPVMLDPIDVTAEATERYLAMMGFYERQRADFGHYVTPEDIDKRQAASLTDLLRGVPGVNVVSLTSGSVGSRYVRLRGSNLSEGGVCRPRVYVDGLLYALGDSRPKSADDADVERRTDEGERLDQGLSLDDIGPPSSIAAVEVYRSASQVPVRFGGTSVATQCGVIVIWTRTGTASLGR